MPYHCLLLRVDLKFTRIFIESVAIDFYLVLEILKYFCKFLVRKIVFLQGSPHDFPIQNVFVFALKPPE